MLRVLMLRVLMLRVLRTNDIKFLLYVIDETFCTASHDIVTLTREDNSTIH